MTIFTDGLRIGPERGITDYAASLGDTLSATAGQAVQDMPSVSLFRMAELEEARGRDDLAATSLARQTGVDDLGPSPLDVPIAQARQRVKEAGLEGTLTLPDGESIRKPVLDIMLDRARARREREATIARGPGGITAGALQLGTSFLVSAADPLNVAAAFIPVVGEARYAKLLADAGESLASRTAVRAGVGAIEGAAGTALLEPVVAGARLQEGQDYTFAEALKSVIFGAGLGAGFHSLFGGVRDIYRRRKGAELSPQPDQATTSDIFDEPRAPTEHIDPETGEIFSDVPPPAPAAAAIADLPPRAKEDLMRGAVASVIDGAPVRAGEMADIAAQSDPRIAESFERAPVRAIEIDVATQLRAAGLSPEEADANAAIVAARYAARADRLEGRAGDALELYRGERLEIRRTKSEAEPTTERAFAQAQLSSDAFKSWFGASKVVDAKGKPQIVFHGTARGGFDTFDTYGSNYGLMGQGSYFTEDPAIASQYTSKGKKRIEREGRDASLSVYPTYLSIKRPIDMDAPADVSAWQKAFPEWIDAKTLPANATNEQVLRELEDALSQELIPSYEGAEIVQDGLRAMGYDGVTHVGGGRIDGDSPRHRVWIAFEPEQIKSAIGNRGTFDPSDANILRQTGRGGTPRGRINLDDSRAIIELFEKADSSTFMHESAHLWLDELVRDGTRADAPAALKQDLDTVLYWLGVEKAEDIGRAQHEKFARAFELYLAEGRAPSSRLAAAFEQFKRWLSRIYQSLTELDVRINDDIRGVFDRMLTPEADVGRLRDLPPLPAGVREAGFGPLGPVLDGFQNRWQDAVSWLRRAETGDAKAVLTHPEVDGPIDVIWGGPNHGLEHIILLHPEVVPDLPERLSRMRLDHRTQAGQVGERIILRSEDGRETAVIRPWYGDEKKTWLLTAYTPDSDRVPGRGGSGRRGGDFPESSPDYGPTRSSGPPTEGNLGPAADPGKVDPQAFARLAARTDDPEALAASREADALAEPESLAAEPSQRVAAIERAAAEAEELWKAHEAYIPDDIKKRVAGELETLDIATKDRAEVIRRGAACLTAAVG